MKTLLTIKSRSHPYDVFDCETIGVALQAAKTSGGLCIADRNFYQLYRLEFEKILNPQQVYLVEATEDAKSYEAIVPVFLWLLQNGLRRDSTLLVVGGGVLQDIGCFIASVLFRGVRWELIPTTLLAQCDSCIGSKSSINIASYKNQIGTFYPPHRVLLTTSVLGTLPPDEIRSGLGEAIKLHLLAGESQYRLLMKDLGCNDQSKALAKAIHSSLRIKQPFIEADEFDRGIRNLLNYGHTFGHAYESATAYSIPHGIAVTLGMLTATFVSSKLGLVESSYYQDLAVQLRPWHCPYGDMLKNCELASIVSAIKYDKKSTLRGVNCILSSGAGRMERVLLSLDDELCPLISQFIQTEL